PLLKENGQAISALAILPDASILARIGTVYEAGKVVRIVGDQVEDVPGIALFGLSPDRRKIALATDAGVRVTEGWQGPELSTCPWPRGDEDLPPAPAAVRADPARRPERLVPFPDSDRVLFTGDEGVFVLAPDGARRLLPTHEQVDAHWSWILEEHPTDVPLGVPVTSMAHGAVSPDGGLIAVGCQESRHLVFDRDLQRIASVGPHGEYPHYALFSRDGRTVAFNACHFYNGATIVVPVDQLPGHESDYYAEVDAITVIEPSARVYAGVARDDEFILGDANGYVRAVSRAGEARWQHFIGSTISAMDMSSDGKTLVVGTYAGFVSIIDLDAGRKQPYQIGTGDHLERRRWLFWKTEERPLAW
ncbi:MAG TPA: WD40 repeat domain-containing protein, partial [Vineibacter sp.]|nr:WD40 repeat domain-containing protein [Vineibacter sp.]